MFIIMWIYVMYLCSFMYNVCYFQLLQPGISKHKFPTKEDGKVAFLKHLQKWPTYGSVFFEVKVFQL